MIGILGGSFDPPHLGHIRLAQTAKDELGLSKIILIPSGTPPHKVLSGGASGEDRLNMARIAAGEREWLSVSDIEFSREGKTYTFDTVSELKKQYPDERFCFICGSDMLLSLHKWYRSEELLKLTAFAALAREDNEYELLCQQAEKLTEMGGEIYVLRRDPMKLSSSDFRKNLDRSALDPAVFAYIEKKGLYGLGTDTEQKEFDRER